MVHNKNFIMDHSDHMLYTKKPEAIMINADI